MKPLPKPGLRIFDPDHDRRGAAAPFPENGLWCHHAIQGRLDTLNQLVSNPKPHKFKPSILSHSLRSRSKMVLSLGVSILGWILRFLFEVRGFICRGSTFDPQNPRPSTQKNTWRSLNPKLSTVHGFRVQGRCGVFWALCVCRIPTAVWSFGSYCKDPWLNTRILKSQSPQHQRP